MVPFMYQKQIQLYIADPFPTQRQNYETLPQNIKKAGSLRSFKTNIKNFLQF